MRFVYQREKTYRTKSALFSNFLYEPPCSDHIQHCGWPASRPGAPFLLSIINTIYQPPLPLPTNTSPPHTYYDTHLKQSHSIISSYSAFWVELCWMTVPPLWCVLEQEYLRWLLHSDAWCFSWDAWCILAKHHSCSVWGLSTVQTCRVTSCPGLSRTEDFLGCELVIVKTREISAKPP
jgi:hypothetical protein